MLSSLTHKTLNFILKLPAEVSVGILNDVIMPIKKLDRNFVNYHGSLEKKRAYARVQSI